MPDLLKRLYYIISSYPISQADKSLFRSFKIITGFRPYNLDLYKLAMRHSSTAPVNDKGLKESNERLEYLGDAILGMIVAEWLFNKFPFKEEGFLTEIRSKIVNRESLNRVSRKIGLGDLLDFQKTNKKSGSPRSIYGDSLEALIGAIYLDQGFEKCQLFVTRKLIIPHYEVSDLIHTVSNFKSKIIEWAQKENKSISFEILDSVENNSSNQFSAQVIIDEIPQEVGFGNNKKKAEQDAARKSIEKLNIPAL